MRCSVDRWCVDTSVPVQMANVGTLCAACRTEVEKILYRGGTNAPTNFGGYLDDYIKLWMLLGSATIFKDKINRFAVASKPGLFSRKRGLSHYLKHFETKCHFPDVEVIPTGVLSHDEFYAMIARGVMWKDVGASINHGLYSHRLQWHVVSAVMTADFSIPKAPGWDHGAYDLFVSLGSGDAKARNIWGKVFDASGTNCFRAPEHVEQNLGNDFVSGLIDSKYEKYIKISKQIVRYAGEKAIAIQLSADKPSDFNANRYSLDVIEHMWGIYYFTQRNIVPAPDEQLDEFEEIFGVRPKPKDKSKRYTDKTVVLEHGGKILRLNYQTMPTAMDVAARRNDSGVKFFGES